MKIGIDLSSLQSPHRMRGIGYTLINLINNLPALEEPYTFVFYKHRGESHFGDPLEILNLDSLNYEVRELKETKMINRKLPGKLNLIISLINNMLEIKDLYLGDSRLTNLEDIDLFLQTDQSQNLPRRSGMKTAIVIYDIIPYVLEWDYLWSYKTARLKGLSRKAAFRCRTRRFLYAYKLKVRVKRADIVISISETTKKDFVNYLSCKASKIHVIPLGVVPPKVKGKDVKAIGVYKKTSWGYFKEPLRLDTKKPYILFIGGADHRRKLEDLVAAFNHLRAEGTIINLVLAGDSMQGPENISTIEIQHALKNSSYLGDIFFLGFVNDSERDWLYSNALAFVFPSRYEGFGLPVLEAMSYGTPVISYDNCATKEVALTEPIYVTGPEGIYAAVKRLLDSDKNNMESIKIGNKNHALKYSWEKTSRNFLELLSKQS